MTPEQPFVRRTPLQYLPLQPLTVHEPFVIRSGRIRPEMYR
jgi:hypothetical protein